MFEALGIGDMNSLLAGLAIVLSIHSQSGSIMLERICI